MKLPQFRTHRQCTRCSLGTPEVESRGIRTRPCNAGVAGRKNAILFVGAYPGLKEDQAGQCFLGETGSRMNKVYVEAPGFPKLADCFLANAVRCWPRDNASVTAAHIRTCRAYLEDDIATLADHYETIVVVACGSEAIQSVLGESVPIGSFPQGRQMVLGGATVTVFGTYLPAILLPGRDPAKLTAIIDHLTLVRRFLRTGCLHTEVKIPRVLAGERVPDPPPGVRLLSLDIETYGAVRTYPDQTVFHPVKSMALDHIRRKDLVLTTALSWRSGDAIHSKLYRMWIPSDVTALLRVLKRPKLRVLGQNIQFDVLYLRAFDKRFRSVLNRSKCTLYELSVLNFLDSDQRPERSLKSLVVLLGLDDYYREINLKKGERYARRDDQQFWRYNVKDAINTLLSYELLQDKIEIEYGDRTPKWKSASRTWFNRLLWMAIEMSENGLPYDRARLERLHAAVQKAEDAARTKAADQFELIVGGKGSEKSIVSLFEALVEKHTPRNPNARRAFGRALILTSKEKRVSTKESNEVLLRSVIPTGHPDLEPLRLLRRYRQCVKLRTSYVEPLLGLSDRAKASSLIDGKVHPGCYIVPSKWSESSTGEGGTQQGRITFKDPAIQTQPKVIESCRRSRFPGGVLIFGDASQIELRVPAGLSFDEEMMAIFETDVSLHAVTASFLAGKEVTSKSDPKWYHAGKTVNFLRIFGGSAPKMQESLRAEAGVQLSLERCEEFLRQDRQKYHRLYAWQESLVQQAKEQGYLTLPVSGISRTFLGDIDETYRPTILNFPVQTLAAQFTLSAQWAVLRDLDRLKLRTRMIGNIYDEMILDAPRTEVAVVRELILKWMRNPPLYDHLVRIGYMAKVKLDAKVELRYNYRDGRGPRRREKIAA